jgi:hypothetical protein
MRYLRKFAFEYEGQKGADKQGNSYFATQLGCRRRHVGKMVIWRMTLVPLQARVLGRSLA